MKIGRIAMVLLAAAVLVAVVAFSYSSGKKDNPGQEPRYRLGVKYPPGRYACVMQVKQRVSGAGQKQDGTQTLHMDVHVSQPDEAGNKTITMAYSRVKMGEGALSMDSDDFKDEPAETGADGFAPASPATLQKEVIRRLLAARLTVVVDSGGKVIRAEGLNRLWDDLAEMNPMLAGMASQFKQTMGNEAVKDMLGQEAMLPGHPVGKGAVWHGEIAQPVPMAGKVTAEMEFELIGIDRTPEGRIAVISFTGELASEGDKPFRVGPVAFQVLDMEMRQKGQVQFNIETGMFVSQTINMKGQMEIKFIAGGRKETHTFELDQTAEATLTKVD
jgi:hypothetical protein